MVKLELFQDYSVGDKQNVLVNAAKHLKLYVRPRLLNISRWFRFGNPLMKCVKSTAVMTSSSRYLFIATQFQLKSEQRAGRYDGKTWASVLCVQISSLDLYF